MARAAAGAAGAAGAFRFEIVHQSRISRARVGVIRTAHGSIDTPAFVPVATNGALKGLDMAGAKAAGTQLMFCNTYHLLLHPGVDRIAAAGGLHRFIGYDRPLITDSGGFQVFSLRHGSLEAELKGRPGDGFRAKPGQVASVIELSERGVLFRSYRDGSRVLLTPESSVAAQLSFGSDIAIPLDELPPYSMDATALRSALDRTHRWQARSLLAFQQGLRDGRATNPHAVMYSVVHGGVNRELRELSVDTLVGMAFAGHAIGGSVGRNRAEMLDVLSWVTQRLPDDKPRHLLGIGDLRSIDAAVTTGLDSFDSCFPTRAARHGHVLDASSGTMRRVHSPAFAARHDSPLIPGCECTTCHSHSASYIQHLFKAHELNGITLVTQHNVHAMMRHMARTRERILHNEL